MLDPKDWDESRARNRHSFVGRRGYEPPTPPQFEAETSEDIRVRYERIRSAHMSIRKLLASARPTTLLVIGDDQTENLTSANLPQLAVYVGSDYDTRALNGIQELRFQSDEPFAERLLSTGVKRGFDIASLGFFEGNKLRSHAHVQVLQTFANDFAMKTVLIFVNAIHQPAPEPARCYAFGELIAAVIAESSPNERVAICASGGMSHFTAGYPWKHYHGPLTYGSISEEFDRELIETLTAGRSKTLTALSSEDLLANGEIEFRSWITLTGAMGGAPPSSIVYEPFYHAIMGMGVACWNSA